MIDKNDYSNKTYNKNSEQQSVFRLLLARFLGFTLCIPLLSGWLYSSFSFICFYAALLHQNRDYVTLYSVLFRVLKGKYFRRDASKHMYWWFFMRLLISFMQEQQICQLIINPDLENNLIELGKSGPGEPIGYNVSYSFVGYSLWLFERARIDEAMDMVRKAALADPKWGYPEYLLGWYGLFMGAEDSIEHFSKAISMDWNFLQRMRKDKTCRQFPELIKEVSKRVVISNKNNLD